MSTGPVEPGNISEPTAPVAAGDSNAEVQPTTQEPSSLEPQVEETSNPAWQEFLDILPSSLHPTVTPVLKKWDQGVQERFQAIHKEYEPYKPLKEQEIPYETIEYGLNLIEAINSNPQAVVDQMIEYYNLTPAQAQQVVAEQQQQQANEDEWTPDYTDPRVTQLEEGVRVMANHLAQQEQARLQQQEDQKLANDLAAAKEKFGEYDEGYVLGRMLNGDSVEKAIQSYQKIVESIKTSANRPPAPVVVGGGGNGLASQPTNPAKITDKERRELAVRMLANAKEAAEN